jgi:hypothetical protein
VTLFSGGEKSVYLHRHFSRILLSSCNKYICKSNSHSLKAAFHSATFCTTLCSVFPYLLLLSSCHHYFPPGHSQCDLWKPKPPILVKNIIKLCPVFGNTHICERFLYHGKCYKQAQEQVVRGCVTFNPLFGNRRNRSWYSVTRKRTF